MPVKGNNKSTNQERNSVEEESQKPVESDGKDVHVEISEVAMQARQLLLHQVLEDILVGLRSAQVVVEVVRCEVALRDGHEAPVAGGRRW